MKRILHILMAIALSLGALLSCDDHDDTLVTTGEVVVEGWIEDGEFPVVKLTSPVRIFSQWQSVDSLNNIVLRWEHVTVSNGEQTVTLTGQYDSRYFPPYIYTTTDLRGRAGDTYRLTVHRSGQPDVVATTTIPPRARVDSFSMEQFNGSDTLRSVFAHVSIPRQPVTYYKLFTRHNSNSKDYLSSFLGVIRSDMIPADGRIAVHKGRTNLIRRYSPSFVRGDTVIVRFAQIDSVAYEYWRSYEEMLSLSRNTFFPTTTNMPTSVSGGMGFWQGMGSSYYQIVIK